MASQRGYRPTRAGAIPVLLEGKGLLVLKAEEGEAFPVTYRLRFRPQLGDSGSFHGSGTLAPRRPEGATEDVPMAAVLRRVGQKATLKLEDRWSAQVLLTSSDGSSFGVAADGLRDQHGKPVDLSNMLTRFEGGEPTKP